MAEELGRWEACLAATALANLSCNLSLADLEGVVDRGGGVEEVGVIVAAVDEVEVAEVAGAAEEAAADGARVVEEWPADSSSARMLSSLASTPATACESREPHLDFWGADILRYGLER